MQHGDDYIQAWSHHCAQLLHQNWICLTTYQRCVRPAAGRSGQPWLREGTGSVAPAVLREQGFCRRCGPLRLLRLMGQICRGSWSWLTDSVSSRPGACTRLSSPIHTPRTQQISLLRPTSLSHKMAQGNCVDCNYCIDRIDCIDCSNLPWMAGRNRKVQPKTHTHTPQANAGERSVPAIALRPWKRNRRSGYTKKHALT